MFRRKKAEELKKAEEFRIRNGRLLLEKMISECDGRSNPYSIFSAKALEKATNMYSPDQEIGRDSYFVLYKGCHEEYDRPVLIKRHAGTDGYADGLEMAINDIVLSTQVNKHNNVLRLLGCCLETEIPILVFEFPHGGNLCKHIGIDDTIHDHPLLSWEKRLEVAKRTANAIAYLHSGLSRPIVHKNLNPKCIFLDNNFVAKVTDFSFSLSIPLGEDHVDTFQVEGTFGYVAREYMSSGRVTEKVDVYAFGIVFLEMLLGEKWMQIIKNANEMHRRLGPNDTNVHSYFPDQYVQPAVRAYLRTKVLAGADSEQFMACGELAFKCSRDNPDERPTMIDVAKEIRHIAKSLSPSSLLNGK